eukprot:gb/GFBE01068670.1/.p1 GENE.gb/GFBE01068670.1/~~gb/GFBE01068670.1/.p1  ORF type:complete len:124 (+),score=17.63 gb/GFBE01068670.1/:1-372(+)
MAGNKRVCLALTSADGSRAAALHVVRDVSVRELMGQASRELGMKVAVLVTAEGHPLPSGATLSQAGIGHGDVLRAVSQANAGCDAMRSPELSLAAAAAVGLAPAEKREHRVIVWGDPDHCLGT